MRGYIIGIDPGALGGIAVLDGTSGEVVECVKMPSTPMDILTNKSRKYLSISKKIRNFTIANKMVVDNSDGRRLSLKSIWAFFMSILYPHTAVSLRKIKPFGVYHLVSSASDTAFCVCNPLKTR